MIRAGTLRTKIELQRKTTARDELGHPVETWTTYARVRAEVVDGAGREKLLGDQEIGDQQIVLRLRYRPIEPVITERVKLGTRILDINQVTNSQQLNHELLLVCTEQP